MRITQEADYALRITYYLAQADKTVGATAIAVSSDVTQRFALKILRKLMIVGIVKSHKGINGGYSLARTAAEITVRDVLVVIDGPLAINKCLGNGSECSKNGFEKQECRFHNIFCAINDIMDEKLSRVTIADVINPELSMDEIIKKIKN